MKRPPEDASSQLRKDDDASVLLLLTASGGPAATAAAVTVAAVPKSAAAAPTLGAEVRREGSEETGDEAAGVAGTGSGAAELPDWRRTLPWRLAEF